MQPQIPHFLTVGILGSPSNPHVEWSAQNVQAMQKLGYNALQLNIAWGARPADEALNLEDVVAIPAGREAEFAQPVPLRGAAGEEAFQKRRAAIRERIRLCRAAGVRSVFHFGAPYNAHQRYGDAPPNCLLDGKTTERYAELVRLFDEQFPGVDDLLLYTYDQDAWLCDEFGPCPRCGGIPLHERLVPFVNRLAAVWAGRAGCGARRLWWEPWELSAGQTLRCIEGLDAANVGLALHSNIAEVMATNPVDRWLRLAVALAKEKGVSVIIEHFLSGATEEIQPLQHLCYPQTLLRSLRTISELSADGIKEYFGANPTIEDVNLRLSALVLEHPQWSDEQILATLAAPYGQRAAAVLEFWQCASSAMELFPWTTSWYIRKIGLCNPDHNMHAAFIRGQQAHTPSWESSRRGVFMKTDDLQPDPWMLEDVELQCRLCVAKLDEALRIGHGIADKIPAELSEVFNASLAEWAYFRRCALSYVYHLRETNLATAMRRHLAGGRSVPERLINEMAECLSADGLNQSSPSACTAALTLLHENPVAFLERYFLPPDIRCASHNTEGDSCWGSKGANSMTSR